MDIQEEIKQAFRWLGDLCRAALKRRAVRSLLIIMGVVVTASGFLLAAIDPGIPSPLAGIWYSLVTLAHVGYGDLVAVSPVGRLVSALLILAGIVLFALAAGIFASILVVHDLAVGRDEFHQEAADHLSFEREILQKLERLDQRIGQISAAETTSERPANRGPSRSRRG